jgi:NAD kinase
MTALIPRVIVVTRETEYQMLLARHATRGQVEFFLRDRGQSIEELERRHQQHQTTIQSVVSAIPKEWRRNLLMRGELDRFLFEPDDLIIAVGQDGLVANTAKYLEGQSVIGVNPDAELYEGILVPFSSAQSIELIKPAMHGEVAIQYRTMAQVNLDDGQQLFALNELFVGHHSHQSARYTICINEKAEHQSSSGVIVATGTGATGWARSIHRERHDKVGLPVPEEDKLAFYVREAFPSVSTGTNVTSGLIQKNQTLTIRSELNEGGVIFGDGIESDYLPFNWGMNASFIVADNKLALVRS